MQQFPQANSTPRGRIFRHRQRLPYSVIMNRFSRSVRLHRPLLIFTGIYTAALIVFALALGGEVKTLLGFLPYLGWGLGTSALYFMAIMAFYLIRAVRTARPGKRWFLDVMEGFESATMGYLRSDRCMDGIIGLFIMFPVSFFFCIAKGLIPTLHKYTIDPKLAAADRWLHFGHYPHEYIMPWIERHQLAAAVDAFYLTWFVVVFAVLDFAIFLDRDQLRRMRFLWAYTLVWIILGNILALLLASVGPLFFADFYHGIKDPYAILLSHLHAQDKIEHLAIFDEGNLELGFTKGGQVINLNALSAMPSMHVAIAALLAFYAGKFSRLMTLLFTVYCALVMVSSVYLGWHYAIDGYAAVIGTGLVWLACGPLVRRLHPDIAAGNGGAGADQNISR